MGMEKSGVGKRCEDMRVEEYMGVIIAGLF